MSRSVDGPRSKGDTIEYRYGITATGFEWNLTEFRKGTSPIILVHASRFEDLAPAFKTDANTDPIEGMKRCAAALEQIAKKNIVLVVPDKGNKIEQAIAFAASVDAAYETNYAIHDKVRERFFGDAEDDSED
jgi:hypothetical protein